MGFTLVQINNLITGNTLVAELAAILMTFLHWSRSGNVRIRYRL